MTLIKLPSSLSDESKTNPTLKGHKLVILTPWAPAPGYIESIQQQFSDLVIEYHPSAWTQSESPFPIEEWKDVTIALTFTYLPQPKDAPKLQYVQLISAGANHILDHPLFKNTEVEFCTANGVHGFVLFLCFSSPSDACPFPVPRPCVTTFRSLLRPALSQSGQRKN